MHRLNTDELMVTTFSIGADPIMEPELKNTDPRACPYTQGWNCDTQRCPVVIDTNVDCQLTG